MKAAQLAAVGLLSALWFFWSLHEPQPSGGLACEWAAETYRGGAERQVVLGACSRARAALPFWLSFTLAAALPWLFFQEEHLGRDGEEDRVSMWRRLCSMRSLLIGPGLAVGLALRMYGLSNRAYLLGALPGLLSVQYSCGLALGAVGLLHWDLGLSIMIMYLSMTITRPMIYMVVPFAVAWGLYMAEVSVDDNALYNAAVIVFTLSFNSLWDIHRNTSNRPQSWIRNFVNFYTFFWVWPSLQRSGVSFEDLPHLRDEDDPSHLANAFISAEPKINSGFQLLVLACYYIQKRTFWTSLLHGWFYLACMTLDPIILHALLSSDLSSMKRDLTLAILLSVSMLLRVSCMEICFFYSVRTMAAARSALIVAIYEKSFGTLAKHVPMQDDPMQSENNDHAKKQLNAKGKNEKEQDIDLPNLMSSDADKLGASGWVVFSLASWTFAVISLPIYIVILNAYVGIGASLAGIGMVIIGGAFTKQVAGCAQPIIHRLQSKRDTRSFLLRTVISTILSIKMCADEYRWISLLEQARVEELSIWKRLRYVTALGGLFSSIAGISVPIVVFAWITKVEGRELDPASAFTILLIISQLSWSIGTLPDIFNLWSSLAPSGRRLFTFFKEQREHDSALETRHAVPKLLSSDHSLILKNASIGFNKQLFLIEELSIKKGQFVLVTGRVGSGKSCFLRSLAGAGQPLSGKLTVCPHRAYVEQKPFLLSGTVKENILFGDLDIDQERFDQACVLAHLDRDLCALPKNINTQVGDGGVQLSGGQRARTAFARALYDSRAELYILDDLLASVDSDTARGIWNDAILNLLDDKKKTVILSSSFPTKEMLARCDIRIHIASEGDATISFNESPVSHRAEEAKTRNTPQIESNVPNLLNVHKKVADPQQNLVTLPEVQLEVQRSLIARMGRTVNAHLISQIAKEIIGDVDDDERDATNQTEIGGSISWLDFTEYWYRFGIDGKQYLSKLVLLALVLLTCILEILGPFWLARWTESSKDGLNQYVFIQFAQVVTAQIAFLMLTVCALAASKRIHDYSLIKMIFSPMSLFDSVPAGRLMNIFSGDLRAIDEGLPDSGFQQFKRTIVAALQVGVIAYFAPTVFLVVPFLFFVYRFILNTVRGPSRDVKRIEAAAHAPVYTGFLDALRGRDTIVAFGKQRQFREIHARKAKKMATARVASEAISKWAQALAVQTGCILYLACSVAGVFALYRGPESFSVAMLALLLTFAGILQRTGMDLMMGWTSFEASLVSIERMSSMMRLPTEQPLNLKDTLNESTQQGPPEVELERPLSIEFHNVSLRYRIYRPLVLKGMSFTIPGGSKVAIVGRTGGGKSSLFLALLRVYPLCGGEVRMGGVNTENIPLKQLRNGRDVRVVLQDAVLPYPTLRANIDPSCSDLELRDLLRRVGLGSDRFITNLDIEVGPGGSILSVGERQLVCLARALAGNPKLLLCDECTSSVDETVDELVHKELLSLKGTTLISILHRTIHLKKFDWIFTVGDGQILKIEQPNVKE